MFAPQTVEQLPNGFFQCFADEVNDVITFKLNTSRKELEKYTTSASSLSRLLGKKDDQHKRYPSKKTGLAIFAGFDGSNYQVNDWDDFETQYKQYVSLWLHWNKNQIHTDQKTLLSLPKSAQEEITSVVIIPHEKPFYEIIYQGTQPDIVIDASPHYSKRNWFWGVALLLFFLLGVYYIMEYPPHEKRSSAGLKTQAISHIKEPEIKDTLITFQLIQREEGENMVSGLLVYDATRYPKDSITIYIDPFALPNLIQTTKRIDTIPVIFYRTSIVRARDTRGSLTINVPTKSWIGGANDNGLKVYLSNVKRDIPKMHNKSCDLIAGGVLSVPFKLVEKSMQDYYFSWMSYTFDKEISLDTFEFETRIKLSYKSKDAICNHFIVRICDDLHRQVKYPIEVSGCTAYMQTKDNPTYMDVETTKIQNFVHPLDSLKQWNVMGLKKKGNQVDYYWNGKYIGTSRTSKNYNSYVSKGIRNLEITCKSSWAVDWITIKDSKKKVIYQEDFNKCL